MNISKESLTAPYLPVAWEYREVAEEEMSKKTRGKIFFFCQEQGIGEGEGSIIELKEIKNEGLFLILDNGTKIRIDRIITLYGKPGAAYDEYDAYGNTCMDCNG